jgi:hypothetical protein
MMYDVISVEAEFMVRLASTSHLLTCCARIEIGRGWVRRRGGWSEKGVGGYTRESESKKGTERVGMRSNSHSQLHSQYRTFATNMNTHAAHQRGGAT